MTTYATATPEQRQRWELQDAIENGTLTHEQRRALSALVRTVGVVLPRTSSWDTVREDYERLLATVTAASHLDDDPVTTPLRDNSA